MKTLHVYFGYKDDDLVYWKRSIPEKCFGNYARAVLIAEKRKKIAYVPVPSSRGRAVGRIETKLLLIDKESAALIESFPRWKRNTEFKRILRKHLEANYNGYFTKKQPEFIEEETEPEMIDEQTSAEETVSETVDSHEDIIETDESNEQEPEIEEADDDEMSEEYKKMLMQMSGQ